MRYTRTTMDQRLSIPLPADEMQALDAIADARRIKRASLVREIVRDYINSTSNAGSGRRGIFTELTTDDEELLRSRARNAGVPVAMLVRHAILSVLIVPPEDQLSETASPVAMSE